MTKRLINVAALALFAVGAAAAVPAAPKLERLEPFGAQRGTQVVVRVSGSDLQDATGFWFGDPAIQATLKPGGKSSEQQFQVTVPATMAPGRYECRVFGKAGVSEARFFVVGSFPEITRPSERTSQAAPYPVQPPVVINGSIPNGNSADWYHFPLKKGDWATLLLAGRSAGSRLDPFLRVLDPKGRSLAWNDDFGPTKDSRLQFRAALDGEYTVEVRDVQYRGGGGYDYRATIFVGPYVTGASPAAVTAGSRETVHAVVSGETRSIAVTAPKDTEQDSAQALLTAPGAPDPFPLLVSELPQVVQHVPNDTPASAQPLPFPCGVTGVFEKIGEEDHYRVTLREKQSLTVHARMVNWSGAGSPTISVTGPDGKLLKFERGTGDGEATLTVQAPVAGDYDICLHDLLWKLRGGPGFGYYAEFYEKEPADFDLGYREGVSVYQIAAGGDAKIHLTLNRHGYDGPVALKVEGLPEGCTCAPQSFPGKGDFDVTIHCAAVPASASYALLRIIGSAEWDGAVHSRVARTAIQVFKDNNDTVDTAPEATHLGLNFTSK